jgi:hypothetical protein
MAISRKPKPVNISEEQVQSIINQGGSVAITNKIETNEPEKKNLQLRLDAELIKRIDESRKKRAIPPPRHTWLLEAIHEKLALE